MCESISTRVSTKFLPKNFERVNEGDICFLYNLDADTLFGPFEARSNGQMNIEPEAWAGRFPAQLKVGCRAIAVFSNASKEFDFLQKVTL
jgi:hypothetical protein